MSETSAVFGQRGRTPEPADLIFQSGSASFSKPSSTNRSFVSTAKADPVPPTASAIPTSACAAWRVADTYQIAKNYRTSVERMEKYYAAHIKTALDAVAINPMRRKKNKNMNAEQDATQNAQS
jgi:hypothetical protein